MKSVSEQLAEYLKMVSPDWAASGALQRMEWKNRDGTLATPRSIVRRLEELVEEGTLKVEYRGKNAAWYAWGNPVKKVWVHDEKILSNGEIIRVPRLTYQTYGTA